MMENYAGSLGKIGNQCGQIPSIKVNLTGEKANDWLNENYSRVFATLQEEGALLIRGLPIPGSKKLGRVLSQIFQKSLADYEYRSTPRTKMRGQVYTSSEYHPGETIPLHNENSYATSWPEYIGFYCVQAAEAGGATPIADSGKVYSAISKSTRREFEQRKLLYVRNYSGADLPWQEVFQTRDRKEVEDYCQNHSIDWEWLENESLRTKQVCQAVIEHRGTDEKIWFNQAHLFHISNLSEDVRKSLLSIYDEDVLPRNVYFGDGEKIPTQYLNEIRRAYDENTIVFNWQEHDLMLLDNMRYAHGRQPFSGKRSVLVGMA
ncbi:TauD/TfdA family dioxygenase [Microbulbifer sp. TYP-18]|uniref:TauD/TfdA family dioxygenase n=1 Tax=Microbulbifer sp. TYP-18 TaxID=3230024 RepID=UPI0034C6B048